MKPPVSGLGCVGGKVDHDQISANAKTKGTITEEQVVAQVLPSLQSLPRIDAVTSYRGIRHITPLKFNMEPENYGFQNESQSPFPGADFNVSC